MGICCSKTIHDPLHEAVRQGNIEAIDRLVKAGMDVNVSTRYRRMVRLYILPGTVWYPCDVYVRDVTPLTIALLENQESAFLRLLDHGASVWGVSVNGNGCTLLGLVLYLKRTRLLEAMVRTIDFPLPHEYVTAAATYSLGRINRWLSDVHRPSMAQDVRLVRAAEESHAILLKHALVCTM